MEKYIHTFWNSFVGYWNYLYQEITTPGWHNYFYALLLVTVLLLLVERFNPWRKQPFVRKGFYLDLFYVFFNFFLFSAIGFSALSNTVSLFFVDVLAQIGIENTVAIRVMNWPVWAQLLTLFILRDFIHWNVHRLLHKVPWMWEFHKIHHSVTQMGVAAHLRYHWMETIFYRTIEYIPLALIGFGIDDFFAVHIFALFIGHLNHTNINFDWGPLKYIFNSPSMHAWHHVKELPKERKHGVNFGISLSLWDYLFGTVYWPGNAAEKALGIEDELNEENFWEQNIRPFQRLFGSKK